MDGLAFCHILFSHVGPCYENADRKQAVMDDRVLGNVTDIDKPELPPYTRNHPTEGTPQHLPLRGLDKPLNPKQMRKASLELCVSAPICNFPLVFFFAICPPDAVGSNRTSFLF